MIFILNKITQNHDYFSSSRKALKKIFVALMFNIKNNLFKNQIIHFSIDKTVKLTTLIDIVRCCLIQSQLGIYIFIPNENIECSLQ